MARYKLCGTLDQFTPGIFPAYMKHPDVDMIECRLDLWEGVTGRAGLYTFFDGLMAAQRWPVIIVCRPKRHGGRFEGSESERIALLKRAVRNGAEWVELEHDSPDEFFDAIRDGNARIVCFYRFGQEVSPSESLLFDKCMELSEKNPDVIRITGWVHRPEECCYYLKLITEAKARLQKDVIAYGLGPAGRWSRIVCLFVGSPWTYVKFVTTGQEQTHQFDARVARLVLQYISGGDSTNDSPCTDPTVCGYRYSY